MANNIQNSLQQIATDQQARQERNNANAQATAFKLPKGVDSPEDQVLYGYGKVEELDDFVIPPADSFNYEYKTGDDLVVITGEKLDDKRGMGEMHVSSQLHHQDWQKQMDFALNQLVNNTTEVHFSITDKPFGMLDDWYNYFHPNSQPLYTLNGQVAYSHTMSEHSNDKNQVGISTKVEGEYLDGEKHGRWEYNQEAELDYGSATLIVNYKMGEINGEVIFKSTMSEHDIHSGLITSDPDYDSARIHEDEDLLEIWKDGVCVDVEAKSAKTFFKNILNHATTGGAISNIQNNSRATSMIKDGDAKLLAQLRANTPKNINIRLTAAEAEAKAKAEAEANAEAEAEAKAEAKAKAEALKRQPEVKSRFDNQPNRGA
jgi:hypothetical protein